MRPYMCTPQPVHAYRWITALASTTFSFSCPDVTLTLSRPTTATCENSAPAGFQHLVQPQTWLCAVCEERVTVTGPCVHLQFKVPPENEAEPFFTPPSTAGWIAIAMLPPVQVVLLGSAEGAYEARDSAACQSARVRRGRYGRSLPALPR